jgi:hypothetical protein
MTKACWCTMWKSSMMVNLGANERWRLQESCILPRLATISFIVQQGEVLTTCEDLMKFIKCMGDNLVHKFFDKQNLKGGNHH